MSTTNFGQGHAAQAQEAPVRGSGDGCRLRSRSVDASAKVGNRRPTPVRYPNGQESTLDTEIELRNVTLAKTTNLTQDITENLTIVYMHDLSWTYAKETTAVYFEVFTFDNYMYNVEVLRIF